MWLTHVTLPAVVTVERRCAIAHAPNAHAQGNMKSQRDYLHHLSFPLPPPHTFPVLDSCPSTIPPTVPTRPCNPARVHLVITSPPPEQKPIQAHCFTPSWHVGQGRWSALRFLGYNLTHHSPALPLSVSPSLFRSLSLALSRPVPTLAPPLPLPPGISSAWWCERTAPENLCGVLPHIM